MTDAILFDLDRTLVDVQTTTDYAAALADVEALIGEWDDPPTPPTDWDGPTRRAMGVLVALAGDPRWAEVSATIERHELLAVPHGTAMAGLHDALEASVDLPRAVVTLMGGDAARATLDTWGIPIDTLVPRRPDLAVKPAPDQVTEALRLLGVPAAGTVMIGDSTWDEGAAHAAGCRFVGVTNGGPSEFGPDTPFASTVDAAVSLIRSGAA